MIEYFQSLGVTALGAAAVHQSSSTGISPSAG
jgi:hypothetical protein